LAACPSCGRKLAAARPRCLYCGAAVDFVASPVPAPKEPADHPGAGAASGAGCSWLVLDIADLDPDLLARALELAPIEAAWRARRGRQQLLGCFDQQSAEAEARRLSAQGLAAFLLPDAEVRRAPVCARGGRLTDLGASLETPEGDLELGIGDVLLVVKGPIVREYQTADRPRRVATARPAMGYRFHLHLRRAARVLEIDPGSFDFVGAQQSGSSLLELRSWIARVASDAPEDDGFRFETPALAPEVPDRPGLLAGLEDARRTAGRGVQVLDNVQQFRLYSGWRGALARRRK
jgi:hypothetical protein